MIVVFRRVLACAFMALLVLEVTSRLYLFGWRSLNYFRMRSMHKISSSRLSQKASDAFLRFELKPNLDTYFQLARFRTNSQGFRDQEYSIEKPDDTFRVAVLGSSFTMPAGVDGRDAFHSVVEKRLNAESDGLKYEFINFAVAAYGGRQSALVLRRKALKFDPDLIMFCSTPNRLIGGTLTKYLPRKKREYEARPARNGFYRLYSVRLARLIGDRFKHRNAPPVLPEDIVWRGEPVVFSAWVEENDTSMDPIEELGMIHAESATPVCLVVLGDRSRSHDLRAIIQKALLYDLNVIDTRPAIFGMPHREFCLNKLNCHPSVKAHRIYAEAIYDSLKSQDLLKQADAL